MYLKKGHWGVFVKTEEEFMKLRSYRDEMEGTLTHPIKRTKADSIKFPFIFAIKDNKLTGFQTFKGHFKTEERLFEWYKDYHKGITIIDFEVFTDPEKYPEYFI